MFRDGVVLEGGAPYATDNTVRIPSGTAICPSGCYFNQDAMRHETFHTVRAKYDGSKAHFLFDAARFLWAKTKNQQIVLILFAFLDIPDSTCAKQKQTMDLLSMKELHGFGHNIVLIALVMGLVLINGVWKLKEMLLHL